jgi:CRP/FNR family transcriptional regulator
MLHVHAPMTAPVDQQPAFTARPMVRSRASSQDPVVDRLAPGPARLFGSREQIFLEGDVKTHLYRIESGTVCLYKMLSDGRRQIIEFAFEGDFIGLGGSRTHTVGAEAVSPARLRCLPIEGVRRRVAGDPRFAVALYDVMGAELAEARDLLLTVGRRSAIERVAAFLHALARRNARKGRDPGVVELPMTRTDIGDFLGLTIETVSRTITRLKTTGVIRLEQSSRVRILDRARLAALADGECQPYH